MKIFDKIFFGILIWLVLPASLFFVGLWGADAWVAATKVRYFAIGGIVLGVILNIIFLRKVISTLFELQNSTLALIYIFYSVFLLVFFLDMPFLNCILGIPAGVYTARRCTFSRRDNELAGRYFRQTAVFAAIISLITYIVSVTIVFSDPLNAKILTNLFHIKREITSSILFSILTGGGIALVVSQYFLTRYIAKIVFSLSEKNGS
jgi:hypothetical protein